MYRKLLAAILPLAFIVSLAGGLVAANAKSHGHGQHQCQQQGNYQGDC